jgi:amino acid transporter
MPEEIQDAGIAVPKAMIWSFAINGIMGLVFLVTMLFAIPDINAAQSDLSRYSFLYILQNALPTSLGGFDAIVSFLIILSLASNISFNASTSRQAFAFARDGGLPFSSWIGHVCALFSTHMKNHISTA